MEAEQASTPSLIQVRYKFLFQSTTVANVTINEEVPGLFLKRMAADLAKAGGGSTIQSYGPFAINLTRVDAIIVETPGLQQSITLALPRAE